MLDDELSSKIDDQKNPVKKIGFFKTKKNTKIIIISSIVLIITVISSIVIFKNLNSETNQGTNSSGVCSGELLDESVSILVPLDLANAAFLDELVGRIINISDYDKDPNCLYPVLQNYVFKGDLENAISTFNKFDSIYGDGSLFAGDRFKTNIENLRNSAELYKLQLEQIKTGNGSQTYGEPANTNVRNPYEQ